MKRNAVILGLAIALLQLTLQINAQVRNATSGPTPAPRAIASPAPKSNIQKSAAKTSPAQGTVSTGIQNQSTTNQNQSITSQNKAQTIPTPIQNNALKGLTVAPPASQAQSIFIPKQASAPIGITVAGSKSQITLVPKQDGYATSPTQSQSVYLPIQTNAPNGYAVASPQTTIYAPQTYYPPYGYPVAGPQSSINAPIQTTAPNGYAAVAPQALAQNTNAPIQTNAPNGYAVPAPVSVVDPTALCDAKWRTALKREIMNADDWQCATRPSPDGTTTQTCMITGPTSSSTFRNISSCGWKNMPPFCDNTINDIAQSFITTQPAYPIPVGYTFVPGIGYYKLHTEAVSWDEAQAICVSEGQGVNLAVPSSVAEYQAILDLVNQVLPDQTAGVFVGITDVAVEGTFVTVTGQPFCTLGQALFLAGEPNNGGGAENCLEIAYMKGLFLNDIPCQGPLPFVCEQPLPSLMGPC